ncbi:MAG: IS66 family transposase [Actinomycetota bacterium]|nr:IS66 family transposase [Actinomycetota bacterium]MDQ3752172.1 IS66 family transposase [Actinomycetota bacterium]
MEAGPGKVFTAEELDGLSQEELIEVVMSQASMIEMLMARVERLEAEASRDSKNSSKPPSADTQPRRAERAKGQGQGRKRGKRPGAQGHRLAPVADPDQTLLHRPESCRACGESLGDAEVVGSESRQVFDIPKPTPFVTEHRAERRRCDCGCVTPAAFPPEATAPACYGPRLRALAVYMLCRQHLPVERCAELLSDVVGVSVSTGWLAGLVPEAGGALVPFVERVTDILRNSPVLGADETGGRVRVAKRWFHVLSTPAITLLSCHRSRGREAICDIGVLPTYSGVIVHDGLALYDGLPQASHAQCNAHLLRHLAAVGVVWDQEAWTKAMTAVLIEAKLAADGARERSRRRVAPATAKAIEARYDEAIAKALAGLPPGPPPRRRGTGGWREYQRQAWNLADRMTRHKADVLRFMTDTRIPFTNNGSERDLRMVKLQQKISGTFQSDEGARSFALVRSYLQTAAKQNQNLLGVLTQLFATGPWLPAGP